MTRLLIRTGGSFRVLGGGTPTTAPPDAPVITTTTPGDAQITVSWTVPETGGATITGYTVLVDDVEYDTTTETSLVVTGLTNSVSYSFTVYATNSVGDGPVSAAVDGTPGEIGALAMGPSGQWPTGFPAYSTAADVTTNGTTSGLAAAISALASTGGVIEHAGDITDYYIERASGTAEILIRPPIGQRADYTISGSRLRGNGICVAGYTLSGSFRIENAVNSGAAWCEGASSLWYACYASSPGETADGFMYEVVISDYRRNGDDRCRVTAIGSGAVSELTIVGSWLTGSDAAPPAHADTIQVLNQSGGETHVYVYDTVIWPSWDKALQGAGTANPAFTLDNCWIVEPSIAEAIWSGDPVTLDGFHAITAMASLDNCVLGGSVNTGEDVTVTNSVLYDVAGIVDGGGNTTVDTLPSPPALLNHAALDSIWST